MPSDDPDAFKQVKASNVQEYKKENGSSARGGAPADGAYRRRFLLEGIENMKIIIVGAGKIGSTLAEQLAREGHDITIIDQKKESIEELGSKLDIMVIEGNGVALPTLREAGVETADLLIAVTASDERNLLACLIAKKAGARHTIARVRSSEYAENLRLIKDDLGLSFSVNPEFATACEIARVMRVPSAIKIDTFARGRVELLKVRIAQDSPLAGLSLMDLGKFHARVLVCAVERGEKQVYIPDGQFRLEAGDRISFIAQPKQAKVFFKQIGVQKNPVKQVMLIGGGRIAAGVARQMLDFGAEVKIIERDYSVCEALAEALPHAVIIHGDGTDQQCLQEEGIEEMDAVASLTGMDEENILISLYAAKHSSAKIITKINRSAFSDVISDMELGSVFYPRYIAADAILRYVRAMQNSVGSGVETLYKVVGNKAEALEFRVTAGSCLRGVPLMKLPLRKNILIGSINRRGRILIPGGQDTLEVGDTVVVVTGVTGLNELDDILDKRRG